MSATLRGSATLAPRPSSGGWRSIFEVSFADEANQSPSGSTLTFGGVAWSTVNEGGDSAGGPKIASGLLTISPNSSTGIARSTASTRTAPGLTTTLANLGASFSTLAADRLLCVSIEIAGFSPSATQEAVKVGIESSAAPLGSGATGRGHSGGTAFQTTQRAGSLTYQDTGGTGATDSTATLAVRSLACILSSRGVSVYSSATPGALDMIVKVLAASPALAGGTRGSSTVPTLDRLFLYAESPDASAGPVCTISSIRVWEKA